MLNLGSSDSPSCSSALLVDDTRTPADSSLSQPSLSSAPSELFEEEAEDDEEDGSIPEHHFEIKTMEGKTGKMKGVIREKVSLMIGNSLFRKRRTVNGSVFFSCNTCETSYNTHLSAIAKIKEDGAYELIEWPRSRDHACWSDGNQALIRQARTEMFTKITENPSRSILQIYEEVRNSITQSMDSQEKVLFLSVFPNSNSSDKCNLPCMRKGGNSFHQIHRE